MLSCGGQIYSVTNSHQFYITTRQSLQIRVFQINQLRTQPATSRTMTIVGHNYSYVFNFEQVSRLSYWSRVSQLSYSPMSV